MVTTLHEEVVFIQTEVESIEMGVRTKNNFDYTE